MLSVPGVYIAHHPWLDRVYGAGQLHKVGHTKSLGDRLNDGAYTTCYPPGWKYVATFELPSKEEASLLEEGVLHCCRNHRVESRELVRLPAADIIGLTLSVSAALGLSPVRRDGPVYASSVSPDSGKRAAHSYDKIEHLTRAAAPGPERESMSDFLDEILSWDFGAIAETPLGDQTDDQTDDQTGDQTDDQTVIDTVQELVGSFDDFRPRPVEDREYQRVATERCLEELRANGRAVLQMACRCGKTPIAYKVIREYDGFVLYLVPGLSLLRQTAQKLYSYGFVGDALLVGSDPRPVPIPDRTLEMTTDPAEISAFLKRKGPGLVISTYQSSPLLPTDAFSLTVFDECHRVCGNVLPRPFSYMALAPRSGARLFMTATPAYEGAVTMKDKEMFGGIAYRYHLRQGITAGYVNDFRLEIVAVSLQDHEAEDTTLARQIQVAMTRVDKLLVFCRDTRQAADLCKKSGGVSEKPFECLLAHSRMPPGCAAASLRRLSEPGVRSALFNCRMFQEGVEVPSLEGVFFASPRHSPRDIIQSLCRSLNKAEGKSQSVIFLPVVHDPERPPEDPANLKRYATIVPFIDALLDEDPRLYEHLLDPVGSPYPLEILGTHSLKLSDAKSRAALLEAIRKTVRHGTGKSERLLRVENVPWDRAFAEIRRIVTTCNRYPKTTDAWVIGEARVCLYRFYRTAVEEYVAWRGGRPSRLEPHQLWDLRSLPCWETYGVEGPYPWQSCVEFLEQWLRDHDGVPPMVEINKGGYVGLEATMMERLSGALTCVNQQVFGKKTKGTVKTANRVPKDHQADLDRLCGLYGIRWRKEFKPDGTVDGTRPSFIQEAYRRFKEYYKASGSDGEYIRTWFPGYPEKHARMENMDVQKGGTAPPKWRNVRIECRKA